jgi:putative spermidine/putrescine transport system permease protein
LAAARGEARVIAAPGRLSRLLLVAFCTLVFVFLMLPLFVVFPLSVSSASYLQFPPPGLSWRWFGGYFGSPSWIRATLVSIEVGCMTVFLSVLLGVPLAFYLVRGRLRPMTAAVDKLVVAPLIIPSIVTAIVLYSLFARRQMIGSYTALVLGHTVLGLPFVVVLVSAALRNFDTAIEDAAMGLGAGRLRAIMCVTIPQIRPSILSGGFFAFMASFDDVVISLFLSGANMTLPRKTFENIITAIDPTVAAVSVLQILFVVALGVAWYVFRRGGNRCVYRKPHPY